MTKTRSVSFAPLKFLHIIYCSLFLAAITLGESGCSISSETGPAMPLDLGHKAPEILTETASGNKMSLSQHKGSIVLVAFWDSGNMTARKAHPELQHIYNTYKDADFQDAKGFCVFSVALDTNRDAWLKAVEEDGITWPCQTIDTDGWNAVSAKTYEVHYTPKYFLVDGEGNIVDRHVDINSLDQLLASKLSRRSGRP